jgi:acetaldehyde dehydrogenase
VALIGVDPDSDGLKRAACLGVATTHQGIEGLRGLDVWPEIDVVFDATSAAAHPMHSAVVTSAGKVMIALTPVAIGPYAIPVVNGDAHLDSPNVNMKTCDGQATMPVIAACQNLAGRVALLAEPVSGHTARGPASSLAQWR